MKIEAHLAVTDDRDHLLQEVNTLRAYKSIEAEARLHERRAKWHKNRAKGIEEQ